MVVYSVRVASMSSSRSFEVYLNWIPCLAACSIISLRVIPASLAARHSVTFPSWYSLRALSVFHCAIALARSFLMSVARSVFSSFSISFRSFAMSSGMRVEMISVIVFTVYICW